MQSNPTDIHGLTTAQVQAAREQHGHNRVAYKKENAFWNALKSLAKEPMVALLLVASSVYFISGKVGDGLFLASAIVLVSAISLYQDARSRHALEKLKEFTKPTCKVIREGKTLEISSEDVVIGDALIVDEGTMAVADGEIIQANDFSVNESILTGESLPVMKDASSADKGVFQGTTVASGLAIVTVTAIGADTRLGKIGTSLEAIVVEKTPLERQIGNFVKKMALVGAGVFLVVWGINFARSGEWLSSLLQALTLAMSILPEEIPVAFTTFMALGAWRLMKLGVVVKQMKTVETLGSATVICTDKTGTLTENKMQLAKVYLLETNEIANIILPVAESGSASAPLSNRHSGASQQALIRLAMWASEPIPFDPMEVALHTAYAASAATDERPNYQMVYEYPLSGKPPMMTHIFGDAGGNRIVAAKGAPEAMMAVSSLSTAEAEQITLALKELASEGYRVLGVAEGQITGDAYPETQQAIPFTFKGLVAFYDPPKANIQPVLESFYRAGISVKIITGDNAETTGSIAKQVGFRGYDKAITGDELMRLSDEALSDKVLETSLFTRMFPDAKLRVINALKARNEIVAMTGDGVNDGPALKAAHIGIAMGKRGTEIAKQAASLILVDDDLAKMVDAIAMGRKIYSNLKKAIQYIISIHIPIILTVFIPLALGWVFPNIFSPVHIIFLEMIMGPTCSIIYENDPMEANAMLQKPRPFTNTFFSWKELVNSLIQGIFITAGTLFMYQYAVQSGFNEGHTRALVFATLIAANIFLTLVNRSFYYSVLTTIRYKNPLVAVIIGLTVVLAGVLLYVPVLAHFFEFERLSGQELLLSVATGFVSVIWFEAVKAVKRHRKPDIAAPRQ